jgi:electron-transferring-flavoprotein dehydrogenase
MSHNDTVSTDVLIIGGGPSGLAASIHLADILKQRGQNRRILLVEKGNSIGSHILSGAGIKPSVFKLCPRRILEIPLILKLWGSRISQKSLYMPFHIPI